MVDILSCIQPFVFIYEHIWLVSNNFEHSKYKHSLFILLILSILPKNQKYWFIPPVLYCCAPIINLFTTCFLSEIFSSFICLISSILISEGKVYITISYVLSHSLWQLCVRGKIWLYLPYLLLNLFIWFCGNIDSTLESTS